MMLIRATAAAVSRGSGLPVVVLLGIALLVPGNARSERGPDASDAGVVWSRELQERARYMEMIRGGLLVVDANEDVKSLERTRFLVDVRSGDLILKGPHTNIWPLTGEPYPIIIESNEDGHSVRAVSRNGASLWTRGFPDAAALATAIPERDLILVLATGVETKGQNLAYPMQLRALSIRDGSLRWTAPLGQLQAEQDERSGPRQVVGDHFAITDEDVFLLHDGRVYDFNIASGKERWRQRIETEKVVLEVDKKSSDPVAQLDMALWVQLGRDVLLSTRKQVLRFSPERGMVWSKRLDEGSWVHGLKVDGPEAALAFRTERHSLVALLDVNSGREKWRHTLGKNQQLNTKKFAPDGVLLSPTKVIAVQANEIVGLDRKTGKPAYEEGIEGGYARILRHGDRIVLLGRESIEARALSSGAALWRRGPYRAPIDRYGQATGAVPFDSLRMGPGPTYHAWRSQHFRQAAHASYQNGDVKSARIYIDMAHQQELTAAAEAFAQSLLEVGQAIGAAAAAGLAKRIGFPKAPLETPHQLAYFVTEWRTRGEIPVIFTIDLDDGTEKQYKLPPPRESGRYCMSAVAVHEETATVVQGFQCLGKERPERDVINAVRIPE